MVKKTEPHLELVLHNIRSAHNVGALFRTADGLGVTHIYLSGYTPYPASDNDSRLPHIARKTTAAITKTALGAEETVNWSKHDSLKDIALLLSKQSAQLIALEQHPAATKLQEYQPSKHIALVLGNEVTGLNSDELAVCQEIIELPMLGNKESFNVASAGAMALHWLRYYHKI